MTEDLNQRLRAYCDAIRIPANNYVLGLIAAAFRLRDPSEAVAPLNDRGQPKVNVTLRLQPRDFDRLMAYTASAGMSTNAFVCGIIELDLRMREAAMSPPGA